MSIPKVIHYCWFGGNPLPADVQRCIESWKKYCPDYEIRRWDESNFDCTQNLYARQALKAKKWAFASDYARLKIVYDEGGIYLDTDVELLRPLDDLLELPGFMGFEPSYPGGAFPCVVATGLGFGAQKGNAVVGALLHDYDGIPFYREDGKQDITPCPERNTATLVKLGLVPDNRRQTVGGVEIFPSDYFCPMNYMTGETNITENTYSIHLYQMSWKSPFDQKIKKLFGAKAYDLWDNNIKWLPLRLLGQGKHAVKVLLIRLHIL